jgi:hypothetical protein
VAAAAAATASAPVAAAAAATASAPVAAAAAATASAPVATRSATATESGGTKAGDQPRAPARSDAAATGAAVTPTNAVPPSAPSGHGRSTEQDIASVRAVFEEIAAVHVAQVRQVMLELRFGDAAVSSVESSLPALRSLRTMAAQLELVELCTALDEFCSAVGEQRKEVLLRRYERLIELIPQAFELDAEHDRREPIIVAALLGQVDGVEKPIIDKLFAVGLSRLETLLRATPDEMAAVSGIRPELAARVVDRFRSYRANATTTVSALDASSARSELSGLVATLREHHAEVERAATGWSEAARARKRSERKQREQAFLRIKVALARLGERERIGRLERLPYQQRIDDIEAYVAHMAQPAPVAAGDGGRGHREAAKI